MIENNNISNMKIKTAEKFARLEERLEGFILHFDQLVKSERQFQEERFKRLEEARTLARNALETKLETMNEFRSQITQERATYVRKAELDLMLKPLQNRHSFNQGRDWALGIIVLALSAAIGVVLRFL